MGTRKSTGVGLLAVLAATMTGCAGQRTADAGATAMLGETEAAGAQEPLPPGWERTPGGALRVPSPRTSFKLDPVFLAVSDPWLLTSVSFRDNGGVARFSIFGASAFAPGTYEVARLIFDPDGRLIEMVPRDVQATTGCADCCWMTVTITEDYTDYACSGACDTFGHLCNANFSVGGGNIIVFCECSAVE